MAEIRWRMCPKCGVKMLREVDEKELEIYVCPICKSGQLTLAGKLLRDVQRVADNTKKNVEDLIIDAIKEYGKLVKSEVQL